MLVAEKKYTEDNNKTDINPLSGAIIRSLLYFDIFQYPLSVGEIHKYCQYRVTEDELYKELEALEGMGYIKRSGVFYGIGYANMNALVSKKVKGRWNADKLLNVAKHFSQLISYFPFVRAVCLSGSLSKGYADKESDIDYFIITQPQRLWLCRTMLVLFKKLFLFNSHKYFCVNYFVDSDSLEIPDKNIFTSTELVSIIPTYNAMVYERLMLANAWTQQYLPNFSLNPGNIDIKPENRSLLKRLMEKLFAGKLGERLDNACFRLTLKKWKKRFIGFDDSQFDLRLRSRKNVSKHHPNGFQERVLKSYEERMLYFEKRFNLTLH